MAIRFNAASEFVFLSPALNPNAAYSLCGWVYLNSYQNGADSGLLRNNATNTDFNNQDSLAYDSTLNKTALRTIVGGVQTIVNGSATIATGAWRFIAVVRESTTSLKCYVDGVLDATNTTSVAARALGTTQAVIGISAGGGNRIDGKYAYFKYWDAALTITEIQQEMWSAIPRRRANLFAWYPFLVGARVKDYSGAARDLTESGTLSDEDNPPVSWGGRIYTAPIIVSASVPRTIVGANPFGYTVGEDGCADGWAMLVRDRTP